MRKYLPTLAELIDRLSIAQLKEVFIPEHKKEYAQEISDIVSDIQLILDEKNGKIDSETIRAIVVLSQMNLHIWHNESNYRKGIKEGNNLELTHGINGIRNTAKNKIQEIVGGRKDYKIDCLAAEFKDWEISWDATSDVLEDGKKKFDKILSKCSKTGRNKKLYYMVSELCKSRGISNIDGLLELFSIDFLSLNGFGKTYWIQFIDIMKQFGYELENEELSNNQKFVKK
jgi:hypothetical protein